MSIVQSWLILVLHILLDFQFFQETAAIALVIHHIMHRVLEQVLKWHHLSLRLPGAVQDMQNAGNERASMKQVWYVWFCDSVLTISWKKQLDLEKNFWRWFNCLVIYTGTKHFCWWEFNGVLSVHIHVAYICAVLPLQWEFVLYQD